MQCANERAPVSVALAHRLSFGICVRLCLWAWFRANIQLNKREVGVKKSVVDVPRQRRRRGHVHAYRIIYLISIPHGQSDRARFALADLSAPVKRRIVCFSQLLSLTVCFCLRLRSISSSLGSESWNWRALDGRYRVVVYQTITGVEGVM